MAHLRQNEAYNLAQVKAAYMESDGTIIVKKWRWSLPTQIPDLRFKDSP